jgi:Holliday junction resolvase RusA-like endonuclease
MTERITTPSTTITAPSRSIPVLDLPPPPSVNETRRDYGKGTAALHRWHRVADAEVLAQGGMRRLPRISGRYQVTVTPDERSCRADLDNGIKAVIDYARRIELVRDDSPRYLRSVVVEWGEVRTGCRLTLTPLSS